MNDHTKRLLLSRRLSRVERTAPVVATNYLYANLRHPLKSLLLRKLLSDRKIAAFVVPTAMQLLSPEAMIRYVGQIYALPDPVEVDQNSGLTKTEARRVMGLPHGWSNRTVVLVFGVLNKRRGVDEIVRLLERSCREVGAARFVFAGKLDRESLRGRTLYSLETLEARGLVSVLDRWLSTEEVAKVFACSDLFCIVPEKKFQGASSTVAQAVANGITVIAPSDSVAGQCAQAKGSAILFRRADANSFAKCLRAGAKRAGRTRQRRSAQTKQADECPLSTGLSDFGQRLMRVYDEVVADRA
jgi:glycosyltransferase involved in cell wall biosynthesis